MRPLPRLAALLALAALTACGTKTPLTPPPAASGATAPAPAPTPTPAAASKPAEPRQ